MVQAITFGPFRLLPVQRTLFENDRPLRLGSRALDILIALADNAGELVSKDELVARVWPKTSVEEDANLRVHVAALRKVLGDGVSGSRYIVTVLGRGYRFVAPVKRLDEKNWPAEPSADAEQTHDLPAPLARMIGRAEIVAALADQLPKRRFVTVVGPGGIGKTTVALAVANALTPSYADGVHFVDLTPLTDERLVPSALAFMLGLAVHAENPIPALTTYLRTKRMLLVFDNCEHVIETAAVLVEQVLRSVPGLHILATSREPLRAEGETVQRLAPLPVPPASAGLTATQALAYPAVRLFVERASACLDSFDLTDADAPAVADICRRLDGIPLAIELTAGRIDAFGLRDLAAHLNDRFGLPTGGRRTAQPRHRTLGATLDWSYELLPEPERALLRRLAVFAGDFTPESASVVAAGAGIAAWEVFDLVAGLIAKSLVIADIGGDIVRYRLLETTRVYALGKLVASGEFEQVARRHAEHYRDLFERADAESQARPAAEWLALYGWCIDNVRAALDWAFSSGGDPSIGVALTAAAVPLWSLQSLTVECRGRVERALASVAAGSSLDARQEMRLYAALGWSLIPTRGVVPATAAAWEKALEIAERLDDTAYQLRALWGLWACRIDSGENKAAHGLAQRFATLAANAAGDAELAIGERLVGYSLHCGGDQTGARQHIERMLARYVAPVHGSHIITFQHDQRVLAQTTLARILWLQGLPDQAMATAQANFKDARAVGHGVSLCYVLAEAVCPVALFVGDLVAADNYVTMLLENLERHGLAVWHAWGRCFEAVLRVERGDVDVGVRLLLDALHAVRATGFMRYYIPFLGTLAEALAEAGQLAQGLVIIDQALMHSGRDEGHWCLAELQRIKGELVLLEGAPQAAAAAEACFLRALECAREQGALSWELRAATSLAQLHHKAGRTAEAHASLAPVYAMFTEGFETNDLRAAKALLDASHVTPTDRPLQEAIATASVL